MTIAELIGFLFTMIILFITFLRKKQQEKYWKDHPEEYAKEKKAQERAIRELLGDIDFDYLDEDEKELLPTATSKNSAEKKPPLPKKVDKEANVKNEVPAPVEPPRKKLDKDFVFQNSIENRKFESSISSRKMVSSFDGYTGDQLLSRHMAAREKQEAYDEKTHDRNSIVHDLLEDRTQRKKWILYHEILGPPKGLE